MIRNIESTGGLRKNFRVFKESQIESLYWNGVDFSVRWKTRKEKGYISDVMVGDVDNNKQDELVMTFIAQTGSALWKKPKSRVIAYEFIK